MKIIKSFITSVKNYNKNTFSLSFSSEYLTGEIKPGQFINVKVDDNLSYILRRPFSVCDLENDNIKLLISKVGKGTEALSKSKIGDEIDVIGPLGHGFGLDDDFETAIILGGGIGIAPFPYLIKELKKLEKNVITMFGFRNKEEIINLYDENVIYSTDDGSEGFKGNVIELLNEHIQNYEDQKIKIFACGPNPMLKALIAYCERYSLPAEVSLESNMACGFGICQGCPVVSKINSEKYYFICKDGPCFNIKNIIM